VLRFLQMSSVMEELLAQSSFDTLKEGAIVPGTITEIRQNEVVVDIGGKAEGVIPASEFGDLGELQIGSQIEVILEKLEDRDGNPIISYDLAQQKKNWDNILQKCSEGSVVSGRVKAKVKGGLIVSIGVDSFLPASHIDIQPAQEPRSVHRADLRFQGPQDQPRPEEHRSVPARADRGTAPPEAARPAGEHPAWADPQRRRQEHHRFWRVHRSGRHGWPPPHHRT